MTALLDVARSYSRQHERELGARIPEMTRVRAAVLLYLAEHDCLKQTQIAEALDLRPVSLVGVLDGLERLGWIERQRSDQDRRVRTIRLTRTACELLPIIRAVDDAIDNAATMHIDEKRLADLLSILKGIDDNVRSIRS